MMKLFLYGFLILLTFTSADHCKHGDTENEDTDHQIELGATMEVEVEQTVKIKGEDIGFKITKIAESRCPTDVNCIVAGEAIATLEILSKSGTESITLEVKGYCRKDDGTCGETKNTMGYNFQLLNIYPYPNSSAKASKKAKLVVTK